jgi:hypothetical protein
MGAGYVKGADQAPFMKPSAPIGGPSASLRAALKQARLLRRQVERGGWTASESALLRAAPAAEAGNATEAALTGEEGFINGA